VRSNLGEAGFATVTSMGGRVAMDYYFVQAFIDDLVDDPQRVLGYLLAAQAATTCNHKFSIGDVIEKIAGDAYLLCDEIFGLRPCPQPHRRSSDQMSELIHLRDRAARAKKSPPDISQSGRCNTQFFQGVYRLPDAAWLGKEIPWHSQPPGGDYAPGPMKKRANRNRSSPATDPLLIRAWIQREVDRLLVCRRFCAANA
jgi:hypothetical protein